MDDNVHNVSFVSHVTEIGALNNTEVVDVMYSRMLKNS